jgi:hypothetical protein
MFVASKLDWQPLFPDLFAKFRARGTILAAAATAALILFAPAPGAAQQRTAGASSSHAHVYLMRGLMNIFSLGMDELAAKIQRHGIAASVHNHMAADAVVSEITARYRAGDRGPVILIGHSLGADAVMEMASALDRNRVPVALVIPFDGTASFRAPKNVASVLNLTQREYAYVRPDKGFHGVLKNLDVSGDPNIGHITIDKSPRMQQIALAQVLRVVAATARRQPPGATAHRKRTAPASARSREEPAGPALRGYVGDKVAGTGVQEDGVVGR